MIPDLEDVNLLELLFSKNLYEKLYAFGGKQCK